MRTRNTNTDDNAISYGVVGMFSEVDVDVGKTGKSIFFSWQCSCMIRDISFAVYCVIFPMDSVVLSQFIWGKL